MKRDLEGLSKAALKSLKRHLERQITDMESAMRDICNDPMNGCPGDFAGDFERKLLSLDYRLQRVRHLIAAQF